MATQTFESKVLTFAEGKEKLSSAVSRGTFKATGIRASADNMRPYLAVGDAPARAKFRFSGKFSTRIDKSDNSESWYANGIYTCETAGKTIRGSVKLTLGQVFKDGAFEQTDETKLEKIFSLLDKAREESVEAVIENRDNDLAGIQWIPVVLVFS